MKNNTINANRCEDMQQHTFAIDCITHSQRHKLRVNKASNLTFSRMLQQQTKCVLDALTVMHHMGRREMENHRVMKSIGL